MGEMNKQISPEDLARTLQNFEKESAKMDMSEEMSMSSLQWILLSEFMAYDKCSRTLCRSVWVILPQMLLLGNLVRQSATHSHPLEASLPNPHTLSHKSSFIPRTCKT